MRTKKLVTFALLCAVALVLGFLENTLSIFSIVPGGKVGLANIITMLVFCAFSPLEALVFGLFRAFLSSILFSGIASFWYSAAGAIVSVFFMWCAKKIWNEKISHIGTSILGAVGFNIGQLFVSACVIESVQIFRYFPVLGVLSAFSGFITGYIAKKTETYIRKEFKITNGANKKWK